MLLAYFSDIKGVSTPPTFPFSAVDYLCQPRTSACHSHIMCIMIVRTYTHSGLLRHMGEYRLKNFSFFKGLIIKCFSIKNSNQCATISENQKEKNTYFLGKLTH